MTTKDSILALAAKISNSTVPNVTTDAQALGELAKAMCGAAPEVPLATVDDAVAFITANYSGGGGGGGATTDVWLWNNTQGSGNDVLPESIGYIKGFTETNGSYTPVLEPLVFESVTEQYSGATIYGVHVKDVPVGAVIVPSYGGGYADDSFSFFYSSQAFPPANVTAYGGVSVSKPIEGFVLSGTYTVVSGK